MNRTTPSARPAAGGKGGRKNLRPFADDTRLLHGILPPPPPLEKNGTRAADGGEKPNAPIVRSNSTAAVPAKVITEKPRVQRINSTTPLPSLPSTTTEEEEDLGDVLGNVWKKVKQVMGFSPPCQNQGHKNLRGLCECPKYFEGEWCEKIVCINNGTKTKVKAMVPQPEVCQCPHPQYITGAHCEYIHCQNGGIPLGNGSCKCNADFYHGQFCEQYASSWFAVIGLPLLALAVVILCCIVCRLDLCPRRSSRRRQNERRRHYGNYQMPRRTYGQQHRHTNVETITDQARMLQENLLNDAAASRRPANDRNPPAADRNSLLVYRLESVLAFNPNAYEDFDYKMMEPPPAYEEAIQARPAPIGGPTPDALPRYSLPRVVSPATASSRNAQPRSSARCGGDEGG